MASASRISPFRRLLTGLARLIKRTDAEPADPSPVRPPVGPADPEIAQALARVRDCVSAARELVPPEEWNAKLEWILGSPRYSMMRAARLDQETIDAVVLGLEELEARVNRTSPEPSRNPFEAARRDHLSRQSVARGLRDATVDYVQASGFSITAEDWSGPPESRFPN
jgi:hypothetical protein